LLVLVRFQVDIDVGAEEIEAGELLRVQFLLEVILPVIDILLVGTGDGKNRPRLNALNLRRCQFRVSWSDGPDTLGSLVVELKTSKKLIAVNPMHGVPA
jgi:hypothetical protein